MAALTPPLSRCGEGVCVLAVRTGVVGDEQGRADAAQLELGVTFIDTADSYGPDVSEELLAEALYP